MTEPYKSAAAVEAAIRDAARNAFAADRSMSTQDRIRQEYFRRFLSRIFYERDDSDWFLKGGTGVLARVASGRGDRPKRSRATKWHRSYENHVTRHQLSNLTTS